jgi:hypothetical protein
LVLELQSAAHVPTVAFAASVTHAPDEARHGDVVRIGRGVFVGAIPRGVQFAVIGCIGVHTGVR